MKPQELAALLKVDPATVRRWAREDFREFLSPNAQGGNSLHRSFDERDVRILAWIAKMRTENIPPTNIVDTLRDAQANNWRDLPPLPGRTIEDEPVALVPREAVEERIKALQEQTRLQVAALERERDELRAQIAELKDENAQLRKRMDVITDRLLTLLEKDRRHD